MRAAEASFRGAGFSLIEMLVAVAVLALAVVALLHLAGENTRSALLVEEHVLAGIVADNRAVQALLDDTAGPAAAAGGTDAAGDRRWRWEREVLATEMDGVARVEVRVFAAGSDRLAAQASVFRPAP